MATAFMKWLETRPATYDRGIHWLTLGRLDTLHQAIVQRYVQPGSEVLEIGCGTGSLTIAMAEAGAQVDAIDLSEEMLEVARAKAEGSESSDQIKFHQIDAALLDQQFANRSFDLILASLSLSEMGRASQERILSMCQGLSKPIGRLVILDEARPDSALAKFLLALIRTPLRIFTWLLTRTTTYPLQGLIPMMEQAGYVLEEEESVLGGALKVWTARLAGSIQPEIDLEPPPRIELKSRWVTLLIDIWSLFFRIVPPYPKVQPRLYRIGSPDRRSPVLVTGNFEITVRRLVNAVREHLDAWILVVDSAGINVWCAAGGGFLTAEKIIGALSGNQVEAYVDQRALILPQLSANGVDGWKIREQTGWGVHWGPVQARDLPGYLKNGRRKTDEMRWVQFPVLDRLEMMSVTLGFYGLLILIPVAIFWRHQLLAVAFGLVGLSTFYALTHPWLPGKDGMGKSLPLTLIALLGMAGYSLWIDPVSAPDNFNRVIGVVGLSVFVAGEMQGMSPHMRGEQANWIPEVGLGLLLLLLLFLVPKALGWG